MGVRSLKVTARHLNNTGCCYEYTIVSVPRIARRYTIQCSLPNTRTVHIEFDGEGGRQRRSGEGWRMGGREQGEGGREHEHEESGREGGREEAMMIGRERASVKEGRVEGGLLKGTSEGKRGGRKRAEEGLRKGGSKGNFKVS